MSKVFHYSLEEISNMDKFIDILQYADDGIGEPDLS